MISVGNLQRNVVSLAEAQAGLQDRPSVGLFQALRPALPPSVIFANPWEPRRQPRAGKLGTVKSRIKICLT